MSSSDYEALRAVVLAGHHGDGDFASGHLDNADPAVRAAALAAMDRLGAADSGAVHTALADPDPGVRRRATTVAAGRVDLVGALVAALGDDDPMVAESAAFALGELDVSGGSDESRVAEVVRSELVEALSDAATRHDDALCRESAVAALGSLGLPTGRRAVLSACGDKATVRRRAVLALAAFDGPEVTSMLERLTADRDLQVRQAAEDLLDIERGSPT